jgi:outer membrane receptor protein involved in Fe transport
MIGNPLALIEWQSVGGVLSPTNTATANAVRLTAQPDGNVELAVATTKYVDDAVQAKKETIVTTAITETVDVNTCTLLRQTASGITTSLSGMVAGSILTIKNRGGGDNTLNITIDGVVSPIIADGESFTVVYNGTDWDLT